MDFFLGGASPHGFKTNFGRIIFEKGYFTYIIKGTAGCGKSTLMKKIAAAFPDEEKDMFYCSADPGSLDALLLKERGVIIVDGTSPHVFEPMYPCAYQTIINMNSFIDQNKLFGNRANVAAVTDEYGRWHQRCGRYLSALSSITDDMAQIGGRSLLLGKADGFTERISRKLLPKKQTNSAGNAEYRALSAITPDGFSLFVPRDHTIYLLADDLFYGSDRFLRAFEENAVKRGYDVIISASYMHSSPMYEHLIIPEIKTAFISANFITSERPDEYRPIRFMRFYDKTELAQKKLRLRFDKGACAELLAEAVNCLREAKKVHDELEQFYVDAADFAAEERYFYKLVSEIKSRSVK